MSLNLNEVITKIKTVGSTNVRCVPMEGQGYDGDHQIEIKDNSNWSIVLTHVKKPMADDIIRQATNKVILG